MSSLQSQQKRERSTCALKESINRRAQKVFFIITMLVLPPNTIPSLLKSSAARYNNLKKLRGLLLPKPTTRGRQNSQERQERTKGRTSNVRARFRNDKEDRPLPKKKEKRS